MEQGQWPDAADLIRRLGITSQDEGVRSDADSALRAAIAIVEQDCSKPVDGGRSPTYDPEAVPDQLANAALLLAAATYKAPDAPFGVAGIFDVAAVYVAREHPTYEHLVRGYRGDFGIG